MANYGTGYSSKVDVRQMGATAWSPYGVSTWSWEDSAPSNDVGTTEGAPGNPDPVAVANSRFAAKLPGQNAGRLTLGRPAFDRSASDFASPVAWQAGTYYGIRIYPAGRGAGSIYHEFVSCLCTRVGQNMGSVNQPVPLTVEFETDGLYATGIVTA